MGDLTYAIILFVLILLVLAAYGMLQNYGLRIRRLERAVFQQHDESR